MLDFGRSDIKQFKEKGIANELVSSQIDILKRGIPHLKLIRPCTIGDGIDVVQKDNFEKLANLSSVAALSGRTMKFVPASGAASRMFKSLVQSDQKSFEHFKRNVGKFAFYDDLKAAMLKDSLHIEDYVSKNKTNEIEDYLLTKKGLDYFNLPKGLIKFHRYPDHTRTAIEEHLVEAASYTRDSNNTCHIHFTVSMEHQLVIERYLEKVIDRYESYHSDEARIVYDINFSFQASYTDTIAIDRNNNILRDDQGTIVFWPGGHGALLANLNALEADIVFVKNIDNVVPDNRKKDTYLYKKMLAGYLVELQSEIFNHLKTLSIGKTDLRDIDHIIQFVQNRMFLIPPQELKNSTKEEKVKYIYKVINRPTRICGMVRNTGEPGGGPFWIENADRSVSMQIVESSQVDMNSFEQSNIWKNSTHFNPVDIVCGVRDHNGHAFNLKQFSNADAGFISQKSYQGDPVSVLELPGLWNGAMADWNTVFVEVPISTFSPVKTVNDLLREEHL